MIEWSKILSTSVHNEDFECTGVRADYGHSDGRATQAWSSACSYDTASLVCGG